MLLPRVPVLVVSLLLAIPTMMADDLRAVQDCVPGDSLVVIDSSTKEAGQPDYWRDVYLLKAEGDLDIFEPASTDTYTAYFHVPIPYGDQAPVYIDVHGTHVIDYRFIELNPPNYIVAARLERSNRTMIYWEAWVLVKPADLMGLPWSAPIPDPEDAPEEVRQWLEPTDCIQSDHPFIQAEAATVREGNTLLQELAEDVAYYCTQLGYGFLHSPIAFDAYYAMNWGSSCTGRAHTGAALFRANGIPARTLHVMPTWAFGRYDMHWIIEYFIPTFGWARMETSLGQNLVEPYTEIVNFVAHREDEFPLFYPSAITGHWHTSDPTLHMYNPDWGRAHLSYQVRRWMADEDDIERAIELTQALTRERARVWGLSLDPKDQFLLDQAHLSHLDALEAAQTESVVNYVERVTEALDLYQSVRAGANETLFFDDFEAPETSWKHGGVEDEWELGVPQAGPEAAHSGTRCWGTDLDDTYENNADNWLLSPTVDLRGMASAYLDFYVYNEVHDLNQGQVYDPLWLDVTTDGVTFTPLCSRMGGVNDDPEIPVYGGWSRMALDLTPYVGQEAVQVRFRFQSDHMVVQSGSYIDDVRVYGRSKTGHGPRLEDPCVELPETGGS
jgi:transglutaminase-like putative cysteine protease